MDRNRAFLDRVTTIGELFELKSVRSFDSLQRITGMAKYTLIEALEPWLFAGVLKKEGTGGDSYYILAPQFESQGDNTRRLPLDLVEPVEAASILRYAQDLIDSANHSRFVTRSDWQTAANRLSYLKELARNAPHLFQRCEELQQAIAQQQDKARSREIGAEIYSRRQRDEDDGRPPWIRAGNDYSPRDSYNDRY